MVDPGREAPARLVVGEQLAREIRRLRHEAGLSQPELAARIGYTPQYVSLAERPRKGVPSADLVAALDAALQAHGALIALRERAVQERCARRASPAGHESDPAMTTSPVPAALLDAHIAAGGSGQSTMPPVDLHSAAAAAARESVAFVCWASQGESAPAIVEYVAYELARIAVEYVTAPVGPLFADLVRVRDTLFELMRVNPRSRQSRELMFWAGTTCGLLAHACQDLGDPSAAMAQAGAALACAERADHPGLRVWVRGTQALIAEWFGRPDHAVVLARSGQDLTHAAASRARLFAIEGRALARAGDAAGARAAVAAARRVRDGSDAEDELAGFGGILSFPVAKQCAYAGSTLELVKEHRAGERAALEAIGSYESGPPEQRSYGDEALARVDVASARLAGNDVEGAHTALRPVFDLPPTHHIRPLSTGLLRLGATLGSPRYARSRHAGELLERIEGFSARPAVAPSLLLSR